MFLLAWLFCGLVMLICGLRCLVVMVWAGAAPPLGFGFAFHLFCLVYRCWTCVIAGVVFKRLCFLEVVLKNGLYIAFACCLSVDSFPGCVV